jgi:isopentenyl-diphosphate Delta-isomerase
MFETSAQFEKRKVDHIRIALSPLAQTEGQSGLDRVQLIHEALPELNFSDIQIQRTGFSRTLRSPIFISSMTAGHADSGVLNKRLARAAATRGWAMGVGSQRKELVDPNAASEWKQIRQEASGAVLLSNLGIAQVIQTPVSQIQKLVENLEAQALFVHLNPLQEVLQKEGTTNFKGGLKAIEVLCQKLEVPVLVKEVGCGISAATLQRLKNIGVYAVDVAGLGGTHWGRIEGYRAKENDLLYQVAQTFKNWGLSTVESLMAAQEVAGDYRVWASGGVRTGLDVAKLISMGAEMVGVAQPFLSAAIQGEEVLNATMERFEYELKVAMFCTGCEDLTALTNKRIWRWT